MIRTALNIFNISRRKVLLKRRKAQSKSKHIPATKKLKQSHKHINVALETKRLNIRKQLDKKKSQNHHINQIIEDLFYPQISLSNQQQVDQRVKQISSDAISIEEQWEELVKMDPLTSEMKQLSLPMELFQLHQSKFHQFQVQHYKLIVERLTYYCLKRDKIKEKKLLAWDKTVKKIKAKDPKIKQIPCPYLFLQRQEIPRHEFWINILQKMREKMQKQKSILELNKYIEIVLQIQRTFYYTPGQFYQLILNKNVKTPIEELKCQDISNLLQLLKYRNRLKFNTNIKIQTPEQEMSSKDHNHLYFARKLVAQVLQHPQHYKVEDLLNIFRIINNRKRKMILIFQNQFQNVENIITPLLPELSFESVELIFTIYCTLNYQPSLEFIEILKYDLFRKAELCSNYFHLLDLITRFKQRKLTFSVHQPKGISQKQLKIHAFDLSIKLSEVITKMIQKLNAHELIQLLDCYFDNDIREISLLQILSTEIIKKGSQYSLEVLGKSLFKLTLLGHKSKIAAKYVLQKYSSKYHEEMKKYKQEQVFLLPTKQQTPQKIQMNFNQIYLQQCLLMTLWSTVKQMGSHLQKQIDIMKMFELFPVKVQSGDPLAYELSVNINADVQELDIFPTITCSGMGNEDFPMGRLKEFYGKKFQKNEIDALMEEQAQISSIFVANYNPKSKMFIKEQWSKKNIYNRIEYVKFCLSLEQINPENKGNSFFDSDILLSETFLEKRQRILKEQKQSKLKEIKDSKGHSPFKSHTKIYDLL